ADRRGTATLGPVCPRPNHLAGVPRAGVLRLPAGVARAGNAVSPSRARAGLHGRRTPLRRLRARLGRGRAARQPDRAPVGPQGCVLDRRGRDGAGGAPADRRPDPRRHRHRRGRDGPPRRHPAGDRPGDPGRSPSPLARGRPGRVQRRRQRRHDPRFPCGRWLRAGRSWLAAGSPAAAARAGGPRPPLWPAANRAVPGDRPRRWRTRALRPAPGRVLGLLGGAVPGGRRRVVGRFM
ncbi:MAG: hypothetical protein AVDCRST_MAG59-4346, partial [uncultured Thermomicrobiales bacterium]